MNILAIESYLDNYKIVDVFQVVSDRIFIESGITVLDDQVSCSSNTHLVCNMAR